MKKTLAIMLALIMVLALVPTVAFAEGSAIYVSSSGNDTSGNGTQGSPYATLAKAVDEAPSGATIYVMSKLTMTKSARFWDKHLTITSGEGGPYTITRGEIVPVSDPARGSYNPAMIEVGGTTPGNKTASLTLKNIVLSDGGIKKGQHFVQAASKNETDTDYGKTTVQWTYKEKEYTAEYDNTNIVQDAIIATYNGTSTITLESGAVLKDFGGMSAIRLSDGELIMKAGSLICDEDVEERTKTPTSETEFDYGPAGAVWMQGGSFNMESGAEIKNVIGRAVYADGGEATIGGTISGITGNSNMWQGEQGVAIHLRNHANVIFTSTCKIGLPGNNEGIYGDGEATSILVELSELNMESNSVIQNVNMPKGSVIRLLGSKLTMENNSAILDSDAEGIQSTNEGYAKAPRNTIEMNGEIARIGTKNNHHNPIKLAVSTLTIGEMGSIHNNFSSYGALYVQKDATVDIYGKIYNNNSSDRGGGIGTPGHGSVTITLHEGAEITGNISPKTGGGASLKNCTFIMEGGTISNNASGDVGGGIYLNEESNVQIKGGTISDNIMKATITIDEQTGIYSATDGKPNDLTIGNNEKTYGPIYSLYISDKANVGNKAVYFQKDDKTITPADDSFNIKFGNASTESVNALTAASTGKGWSAPLATFWTQRDNAATMTVGGLTLNNLPVYVLTQKTGADGKPASSDAPVHTYAATVDADGNVNFTLPSGDMNGNGCAVAIVQPTTDYGTLTISGPDTIQQNTTGADYPVTYTVTYTMSDSMKSIIAQSGSTATYSLTINKDTRLTGTPGTFNGTSIDVTYTLPNGDFTAGESLFASAELTITIGNDKYIVPSNVAETKMIGSGSTGGDSTGGDSTGGDSTGGGHYHPDPTPVPVVVIPPKTGDMTLWQSMLHFFGIR